MKWMNEGRQHEIVIKKKKESNDVWYVCFRSLSLLSKTVPHSSNFYRMLTSSYGKAG